MRVQDMIGALQLKRKKTERKTLCTPWGEKVTALAKDPDYVPLSEYPRPQFVRESYTCLNGWWQCAIVNAKSWESDRLPVCETPVLVPFSPETQLSGVGRTLHKDEVLWYTRTFHKELADGQRTLLHFEAVDQECVVYVNGVKVSSHQGGYLPFEADITKALKDGDNTLSVKVRDATQDGPYAYGKQTLSPGGMWYSAQSGIWQSVWMEDVPDNYITTLNITCLPQDKMFQITVKTKKPADDITLAMEGAGTIVSSGTPDKMRFDITLDEPKWWSPDDPYLYHFEVTCEDDHVSSYTAMRSFTKTVDSRGHARFCLNGEPLFLKGVLDQGYWPESLMTPPDDEALVFDIEAMQDAGMNLMREHCHVASRRFYYHCDTRGMLVTQDFVNSGAYHAASMTYGPTALRAMQKRGALEDTLGGRRSREECLVWIREALGTMILLRNVPSLCAYTVFNEGWGQFKSAAVTQVLSRRDPARLFDSTSGWFDTGSGDFLSVHNYFDEPYVPQDNTGRIAIVSEYGGLSLALKGHVVDEDNIYGYRSLTSLAGFQQAYHSLQAQIKALEQDGLAGAIYTQVSDIEEETNGLVTWDRKVKKLSP